MDIPRTSLPEEVLLTIFKFTDPPPHLYVPDVRKGPRNPWLHSLRTKKSLALVCKLWAPPATEFLYSHVVLRRMGQISALANTFRTDTSDNLSTLVRSLSLDMCVILSHCAHALHEDLQDILTRCTMLLSFTWNPHPHPRFEFGPGPLSAQLPHNYAAFNPSWIIRISPVIASKSRLLTLSLDIPTDPDDLPYLAKLLSSTPHLTSLHLGPISLQSSDLTNDPWSTLPDLVFPALSSLSIHCDILHFVHYVTQQWTMPHLASLYSKADFPISILSAHGQHLTYLHIYSERSGFYPPANVSLLPRLHELCPRLEHLVVPLSPRERAALNFVSPSLRYLDLTAFPSVAAYRAIALAPTARAPRLRKVRMVMGSPTCDAFPLRFHPTRVPGSDRALEDLADVPWADGDSDDGDVADWLVSTTGGITEWCPEGLVRQHSWAVILDERCEGSLPPEGFWDSTVADDDAADSEGEYEYESRPTSPVSSQSETDDDGEMGEAKSEDGGGSDSDMGREWFELEPEMPPYPNKVQFVDDPLDSSRGQYDREMILERFAQSQLGDFLLE